MQQNIASQMYGTPQNNNLAVMPPDQNANPMVTAQNNLIGGASASPATPPGTQPNPMVTPPPTTGQTAMNPAPGQYSQWGQNPEGVLPPPPPGGVNAPPLGSGAPGMPPGYDPNAPNQYGGQTIAGADPNQADYGSVQNYADQAYDQARRRIDPMQEQQGRRMEQDLVNKGIDPSSAQGKAMLDQQNRDFADQNNSATFGALQFGQGIQNQMFGQEQQQAELAGQMQQGLWGQQLGAAGLDMQGYLGNQANQLGFAGLGEQRYGNQLQNQAAMAGLGNQRYGMDLQNQQSMGQLDYMRNQGEHGQMMDLLGYDMNVNQYNQQQQMIQDAMYNQAYSGVPIPGMSQTNPYGTANTMLGAGDTTWWNTKAGFQ